MIAPLVKDQGKYYAALSAPQPDNPYVTARLAAYIQKFGQNPARYGTIELTTLAQGQGELAPPGSVDMVVTFRNIHNWMYAGWAPQAFAKMYKALKPKGILGIEEHRAAETSGSRAKKGYLPENGAIAAGGSRRLQAGEEPEINANPKDTKDYSEGRLDAAAGFGWEKDKMSMRAIGESDRITLKFVKPKTAK